MAGLSRWQWKKSISSGTSIAFGKKCIIQGNVISDNNIDINDVRVKGHIWTRSIVTSNGKQSFTNYLVNTTLQKPDVEIPFPLAGELPARIMLER